jgi:hypothetical protein
MAALFDLLFGTTERHFLGIANMAFAREKLVQTIANVAPVILRGYRPGRTYADFIGYGVLDPLDRYIVQHIYASQLGAELHQTNSRRLRAQADIGKFVVEFLLLVEGNAHFWFLSQTSAA